MATQTQYTVKVPLNPTSLPSTDKIVVWNVSEGRFNLSDGESQCVRWEYSTSTTPTGISVGQVRFNNSNIESATEIYIHIDAVSGSNDWEDYFTKLVRTLCCTLTISKPNNPDDYVIFDYDSENSVLFGSYLKFAVSNVWAAPLVSDGGFTTLNDRDELCLSFDLFRCENTNTPGGGGGEVTQPCYSYWQYSATTLSAVTSVNDVDINDFTLGGNGGNGQFTIGLTGDTLSTYTLSVGDPIFIHITESNYWGDPANAMDIDSSSQVILTQWNSNGTSTTGEQIIIETSSFLFSQNNGYVVFGGEITQITSGLSSGISDGSFFCIEVFDITHPSTEDITCDGYTFRMGVFDIDGSINLESTNNEYQFDGTEISNGDAIGDVAGGGIYAATWSLNYDGYGLCPPFNYKQFLFAQTDNNGNDTSSFFENLVVGDKFRYLCLYDDVVNSAGDYITVEIIQDVTTSTDTSGNTFYILKGLVLLDESDIINCTLFFSKPNNLICVNEVSQIAQSPPPPGSDEIPYIVERIGSFERPTVTGSTSIESSDITSLSGTTLRVTNIDSTGTNNTNRITSTISYVTMSYLGCEITYEVDSQVSAGTNPTYEEITLGDIVTNGFNSPRGVKYSASTISTGTSMNIRFDTSASNVVINPGEDRLTTSNGSTNKVVAQPNLKFSGDVLYITSVTQYDTSEYSGDVLEGQIRWNSEWSTFDMGMNENVTQQVGQEQYYYVKNQSGKQIDNGSLVMATGTTGNSGRILVTSAITDGTFPARYVMGVATENIPNGEDGYITSFGLVRGIDTSMYSDGDVLWADPTVPGGLTNIEPSAPNVKMSVAIVVHAHSNGNLFVRPTFLGKLGDLQDLQTSGQTNGDLITYDSSTGIWNYGKILDGNYTISGNTIQYGEVYQRSVNIDTTTTGLNTITSIPLLSGESIFFHYVVKEKSNNYMRTGTVMSVNDGTLTEWTDTSTPDINGSTKGIEFNTKVESPNLILRANVTSGTWNVKVRSEVIF